MDDIHKHCLLWLMALVHPSHCQIKERIHHHCPSHPLRWGSMCVHLPLALCLCLLMYHHPISAPPGPKWPSYIPSVPWFTIAGYASRIYSSTDRIQEHPGRHAKPIPGPQWIPRLSHAECLITYHKTLGHIALLLLFFLDTIGNSVSFFY